MKAYLDNAATTPVAPEVIDAMTETLKNCFGNPSSTHQFGRKAKALLVESRNAVAKHLNCSPSEIIFTSGGTEADNMAILCAINDLGVERIITSPLEHKAVLDTSAYHCKEKLDFQLVKLTDNGHVDFDHLESLLKDGKKTLVSLMHGNNEIGNLLDLNRTAKLCRQYNAYFHSDTVQTMGHYRFDLQELDIDFITGAAHKFHGPKGTGFLYVNKKLVFNPLIHGGGQESKRRGGTENIHGIVGMCVAMDLAYHETEEHEKYVCDLKQYMIAELKDKLPGVHFHGDVSEKNLYTVLNVCLPPTPKGGMLLFSLDIHGIAASGGSACSSGSTNRSHVLEALNSNPERPNARFSFSRYTTKEEIDYAVKTLAELYNKELASL